MQWYVMRGTEPIGPYDGETVAERQTVVITGGTIAAIGASGIAVPPGAQDIAGDGRTLLPGLIDAHVHLPLFGTAGALQQNLAFGVTTAVVMGGGIARMKDIETTDAPDLAAILLAGQVATAPGGRGCSR